jgi:hypothetical protein
MNLCIKLRKNNFFKNFEENYKKFDFEEFFLIFDFFTHYDDFELLKYYV